LAAPAWANLMTIGSAAQAGLPNNNPAKKTSTQTPFPFHPLILFPPFLMD
jgi:hypothetical protein